MHRQRHSRPDVRAVAAKLLQTVVEERRSLDRVLTQARLPARDRPLLQELVTGSVRRYFSLDALATQCLHRPIRAHDSIVRHLLIIGLYQVLFTRIPKHAAVAETVKAAPRLGKPWAKGVINQVLRRVADGERLVTATDEATFDHPTWLIDRVRTQYPEQWAAILDENNRRAPMMLRVNRRQQSTHAYRERLAAAGIDAAAGWGDTTLILERPVPSAALPGFADGAVSIQDGGAQLAAALLDARDGEHVLDACAAPGGKAMHTLERAPDARLVAVEVDAERCSAIEGEHARLRLPPIRLVRGDATALDWWDGTPFDRVLVDAPCSGTGTIRRHPDIKLLKNASDLDTFAYIQSKLLENLWHCVAKGGRLLYCTCSILTEENDQVVARFLAGQADARVRPLDLPWGQEARFGRQLLPGPMSDGFYFAMLERLA
jgi:16S rRNA (cytosine967-C5)-methyltransferase